MGGMLLAQAQTRAIGPCEYEVLPLPARTSLRVMTRVLKMAAPAFGDVSSLRDAAFALGKFLASGMEDLDEDVIVFLTEEFAKVTRAHLPDGRKVSLADPAELDDHFRGRLPDMFAWLKFSAEVTYGPLGEALRKVAPKLTASMNGSASSPNAAPEKPASPSTE